MPEVSVTAEGVSKKFCKSLKRSMLYGVQDIVTSMIHLDSPTHLLRPGEFWAFDNVSFEIKRRETIGLIGPNGSGKTTLLKMLNGILLPDKGSITIHGSVGALIELGAGFHPMLTGRENIYINASILGMTKREVTEKFDRIVDFAGIGDFIDVPVKHYSSGMFARLGFAIAVHSEPDILLVDEILAVGDEGFQSKCFNMLGQLREQGTAIVLVSHNMHIISTFSERVILLHNSTATVFNSVTDGVKEYSRLFAGTKEVNLERICSGNETIRFFDVAIPRQHLAPGQSFSITMHYESLQDYYAVGVDTAIVGGNEPGLYFQATNNAYRKQIDLPSGRHALSITIENIPLHNASVKIAVAVWAQKRSELLFWWRIPVAFTSIDHATGKNFLQVTYGVD